jgi:hypothetical protein
MAASQVTRKMPEICKMTVKDSNVDVTMSASFLF